MRDNVNIYALLLQLGEQPTPRMFCRNRRSTCEAKVNSNPTAMNIRIYNPLKSSLSIS